MNITINKGTTDVIIDVKELIELLSYKVIALNKYTSVGIEIIDNDVIHAKDTIIHLQEYLLSIYKE
jgi:hypothetical protein